MMVAIILTLCATSTATECEQDIMECLDRYEESLDIIDRNTELIKELSKNEKKNVIYPYVGLRFMHNYIYPQVGLGYMRNIKRVGFKNKFFYLGIGGSLDFTFNRESIKSIGISGSISFMF